MSGFILLCMASQFSQLCVLERWSFLHSVAVTLVQTQPTRARVCAWTPFRSAEPVPDLLPPPSRLGHCGDHTMNPPAPFS